MGYTKIKQSKGANQKEVLAQEKKDAKAFGETHKNAIKAGEEGRAKIKADKTKEK